MRTAVTVIGLFVLLTLIFAYPLSVHPGSHALDLGPDTRLFLWTLAWDAHALASQPLSLFDANIFYPEPRTLAYSEHQLGSALFAAPLLAATGGLLFSMNIVLLLSCVLSGVGAFYLARELGAGFWGALLTGILFAFTPPRFFRLGQLHLATVQWIPFCLLLLHRYAKGGTTRHLVGASCFFSLQAWSGGQSGLFLALAASGLILYLLVLGRWRPSSRWLPDFLAAGALALILNVPFVLPYLDVQKELGLERTIAEAVAWSPNAASFVASPTHVHRLLLGALGWATDIEQQAKAFLFPGFLALLLPWFALVAPGAAPRERPVTSPVLDVAIAVTLFAALLLQLVGGVRVDLGAIRFTASSGVRAAVVGLMLIVLRWFLYRGTPFARGFVSRYTDWADARIGVHACFYGWLAALSLWASLGPPGGLYTILYELVPGFDFIRVPSRLTLLTVLALAVLSGFGLESITRRRVALAPVLVMVALTELASFPLPTTPYSIHENVMDAWLAERPSSERGPVIVLPIPDPRDDVAAARYHSSYMLFSIAHFLPLVNGYSGFTPPEHDRLFRMIGGFPDAETLSELRRLGVRYAVLHRPGYGEAAWQQVTTRITEFSSQLALRAEFDEGAILELVD